jgi:hypothetical protein
MEMRTPKGLYKVIVLGNGRDFLLTIEIKNKCKFYLI